MISIGLNVTRLLEKRFKAPSSHTLWEINVYAYLLIILVLKLVTTGKVEILRQKQQ